MTKSERRIKDFSAGMKKLGGNSREYINRLSHFLLLVEQPPVYPGLEKNPHKLGKKRKNAP